MGLTSWPLKGSVVPGQFSAVSHLQSSRWLVLRSKLHLSFHTNLLRMGSTWEQPATGLDAESADNTQTEPSLPLCWGCDRRVTNLQEVSAALDSGIVLLSVR